MMLAVLLGTTACLPAVERSASPPAATAVSFERFVLPNGLTLIVHEEHAEPIVHVRMFYHVAEKDAGPDQAGYAHLFEHLAFSRTEHLDQPVRAFLEAVGASDSDAQSQYDYTHYFATVPVSALDTLLWLEAERMAYIAGALTEEDLDRSRSEVFREEERLLAAPPVRLLKATWENTYPEGHPYHGFNIASEDVSRATLLDAYNFYERYHHPANAVLVVAGDVNAEAVRERVDAYFGSLAAGTPRQRAEPRIGRWSGTQRRQIEGLSPGPLLRVVWNIPEWGTADADRLTLASTVIESRVREQLRVAGLPGEVRMVMEMRELGSQIMLDVIASSATDFADIDQIVRTEIDRLASQGPGAAELDHARAEYRDRFDRESAGVAKLAHLLGRAELFRGDPGHPERMLRRVEMATPDEVRAAAAAWLTDGFFVLEFVPEVEQ